MKYNFLDDFNKLHDNIDKWGLKDGFEKTLNRSQFTEGASSKTQTPLSPRKLSEAEIKSPRQAGRKLNPFDTI